MRHVVLGELGDPREKEVEDRLALHSLVEDGEYVRLVVGMDRRADPAHLSGLLCRRGASAGDLRQARGDAGATRSGSPTTSRP